MKHSVVESLHFDGMEAESVFGKKIPVVLDEMVKRGNGSETHGLCPAHTLGDHEVAKELGIDIVSSVNDEGVLKLGEKEVVLDDPEIEEEVKES